MAHINQYKSVKALREAIIAGICTDQDLLDWEYTGEVSKWLASHSETDCIEKLRMNYKKEKTDEELYSILLEALSFTPDEIMRLKQGCFVTSSSQAPEDTVEGLKLRIEELKKLFIGSISLFPSGSIPLGWLPCEGQYLPKEYFKSLYLRLGNTWGSIDSDQFVLPNLNAQPISALLKYCIFSGVLEQIPEGFLFTDKIIQVNGVSFVLKPVVGGIFKMGSNDVKLSGYYIGQYPVTQVLWVAVMGSGDNPSGFKGDTLPVERVSWNDCQRFLQKLNALTGGGFRLPTEAEWEFAARGGVKSGECIYSGSNNLKEVGWYADNSGKKTHPVGQKLPNELGLFDMSGNICEWCQDLYDSTDSDRVCRGGSWRYAAGFCAVSYRRSSAPDYSSFNLGFRLAFASSSK